MSITCRCVYRNIQNDSNYQKTMECLTSNTNVRIPITKKETRKYEQDICQKKRVDEN